MFHLNCCTLLSYLASRAAISDSKAEIFSLCEARLRSSLKHLSSIDLMLARFDSRTCNLAACSSLSACKFQHLSSTNYPPIADRTDFAWRKKFERSRLRTWRRERRSFLVRSSCSSLSPNAAESDISYESKAISGGKSSTSKPKSNHRPQYTRQQKRIRAVIPSNRNREFSPLCTVVE